MKIYPSLLLAAVTSLLPLHAFAIHAKTCLYFDNYLDKSCAVKILNANFKHYSKNATARSLDYATLCFKRSPKQVFHSERSLFADISIRCEGKDPAEIKLSFDNGERHVNMTKSSKDVYIGHGKDFDFPNTRFDIEILERDDVL